MQSNNEISHFYYCESTSIRSGKHVTDMLPLALLKHGYSRMNYEGLVYSTAAQGEDGSRKLAPHPVW